MLCQLPIECLSEIFEYLKHLNGIITLYSCLLVSRLWCEVSVRILWRNVCNCKTLITCLPNESKEILYKNKIIISDQNSKPPLFNYISFIKSLSVHEIDRMIEHILKNNQPTPSQNLEYDKYIVSQEIFKGLINQTSLKELSFYIESKIYTPKVILYPRFTSYPGAKDCLKDLSELSCSSDLSSEIFYQLSQLCNNIQSLNIIFEKIISDGITNLIHVQRNLKYLDIMQSYDCVDLGDVIPSLKKPSSTLIKLDLYGYNIPLSFIAEFTNLQELVLSFYSYDSFDPFFENFNELHDVTFPQLQILKFEDSCPKIESLIKFLKNNGKSLKEFHVEDLNKSLDSLNLAIAKFCPNIKILSTLFLYYELATLEKIFNHCQYLESIKVWCGDNYLIEEELLEVIVKHSPRKFYELKLHYTWDSQSELLPKELESFLESWANRTPQKSLSLMIVNFRRRNSLDKNGENMKIIEKYIKLGVIKKFKSE